MERTQKPRFVRASRVKNTRRCEGECGAPTAHILYRIDDEAAPSGCLTYDCQVCGETAYVPAEEATEGLTGRPA